MANTAQDHLADAELAAYAAGPEASPAAVRAHAEEHLAGCDQCSDDLMVVAATAAPPTAEEEALIARAAAEPVEVLHSLEHAAAERARKRRRAWVVGTASMAGASLMVLVAVLIAPTAPPTPDAVLAQIAGKIRLAEPAISRLAYAPFKPSRGPNESTRFEWPQRELMTAVQEGRPGGERALALLYALRGQEGDSDRAAKWIAAAGNSADDENDRGVLLLLGRNPDPQAAAQHFARALALLPGHVEARFNLVLAYSQLGNWPGAAQQADELRSRHPQSPWVAEAQALLKGH